MNRYLVALFGTLGLCLVLLIAPYTTARGEETNPSDTSTSDAAVIYLPSIFKDNAAVTPTPTLISTAPPRTPTLTGFETETPTATSALETATSTPTLASTAPTATPTPTASGGTELYPPLSYSCTPEPDINDSVLLKITVSSDTPVPSTVSFRFEPTEEVGPINNILGVGPFSLVSLFTDETSGTSTGDLTRCDTAGQCQATFTVTQSSLAREVGKTVLCEF